jgi:hypothetical protein
VQDKLHGDCRKFNVGEDCPAFDGLFDYCRVGLRLQGRGSGGHMLGTAVCKA